MTSSEPRPSLTIYWAVLGPAAVVSITGVLTGLSTALGTVLFFTGLFIAFINLMVLRRQLRRGTGPYGQP